MSKLPKANKELGQHFLRDQKVINTITNDWNHDCDIIIEVGPGPAVLTQKLSAFDKPLYLIEKDQRFKEKLAQYTKEENIFIQDALKFNWKDFIKEKKIENKKIWLVSNLPYNVGTLLFTQFLQIQQIQYMTLMFQKEVGDKTYLRQNKNQMNGLLTLSLNYFDSKHLIKVLPGSFSPPPKVDSVVISYQRKNDPIISIKDYAQFNDFTRKAFSQKRKQLFGVLKKYYPVEKLEKCFNQISLPPTLRAEALSFDQIISIFKQLNEVE